MPINYNKLIRDRIPEIITQANKEYEIEVMGEKDYRKALFDKLVEEAQEAQNADQNKLEIELADLLEVIDAIIREFDLTNENINLIKNKRREERGGFEKRLKLLWTT